MLTETEIAALMDQWERAAYRAAQKVASRYAATTQERDDLDADALTNLWLCVREGHLRRDTAPALAVAILTRHFIRGLSGFGIYSWRPDCYCASKPQGGRAYIRRNECSFRDLGWWEAESLKGSAVRPVDTILDGDSTPEQEPDTLPVLAELLDLNEKQIVALEGKLADEAAWETAERVGSTRDSLQHQWSIVRDRARKPQYRERVRALLGGVV